MPPNVMTPAEKDEALEEQLHRAAESGLNLLLLGRGLCRQKSVPAALVLPMVFGKPTLLAESLRPVIEGTPHLSTNLLEFQAVASQRFW